jgi:hypothetical protein
MIFFQKMHMNKLLPNPIHGRFIPWNEDSSAEYGQDHHCCLTYDDIYRGISTELCDEVKHTFRSQSSLDKVRVRGYGLEGIG